MYAVIVWNIKNGVALRREELEVMSASKLTVMNGGKMATGSLITLKYIQKMQWNTYHNKCLIAVLCKRNENEFQENTLIVLARCKTSSEIWDGTA